MTPILKAISCVIIVAVIFYYNQMVKLNEELLEANAAIEEMSVTLEQVTAAAAAAAAATSEVEAAPVDAPQGKYKDGVYSGTAKGYGGPVTTEVTIESGFIVGIQITSSDGEDAAYYNMCLGILDDIAKEQSADVDTVLGATLTAKGIIGGAAEALAQAEKP
ncbi:MAG: FMN-binding protein [Clostridiales Family XIII bacterium]|jgi:uncharacterized protein with FMN-binding domain|nr:FMN-binding protein [Clostridiales Family XIII bacterium]